VRVRKYKTIVIILLTLVTSQTALANSAEDRVHKGNGLYAKGHFNDALKEYDQALIDRPEGQVPKFNQANCYFQLDDLTKAIDLYNEVAAESKDMELVAKAKYNLGNSYFQRGSKQKDSNLQKALEDLQTSIVYWRSALEINPQNENAAKNIEVARLIIKDIIDQINKQKEQQQQQAAKQKQLQEQLKELAEKQKALAQKTQQTKKDADEGQISRQEAEDKYKEQAQEQSQLQAETELALQQMQQQDPNNPMPQQMQEAGSELEQAVDAQMHAEKQLKASDGDTAKKSQDKAAKHLEDALKKLSQDNQAQQEKQGQTQQPQESNEQKQQHKEQKATVAPYATAQEILDKEQREKKQRQILQQGGYQKVEKDW
jgi:Ca-activated chloride channel family protein